MINYSTAIVNNQFQVTFDFTPKDISYSRNNYTAVHKGNGTTHRNGIWEGIECIEAQIKIGDGAWTRHSLPGNKQLVITVNSNNTEIQAWGKYRLKTMGYQWLDRTGNYPFFWYGNIGGVDHRYKKGSFRDSVSNKPDSNFYTVSAMVPADWKYIKADWSDWAYIHSKNTGNYTVENGRFEKRNGNHESARDDNGWISDSRKAQMWRKSSLFWFEKEYYSAKVKSSGIAVNPLTPSLEVYPAKGDSGQVKLTYLDPSGIAGRVRLKAYCRDKQADIDTYDISGHFGNNGSWTYTIDFNSCFGEAYRSSEVYYEAWSRNDYGYESPSTGRRGTQIYNGRPNIPTGLRVEGENGLIYNAVNFTWDRASDPDGDHVVYDLWVRASSSNGVIRDDYITRGYDGLKYRYDISGFPDGTDLVVKVRSSDNLITSDWSSEVHFKKGSKPNTIVAIISPIKANTDIYFNSPRFAFSGWDKESTCVVVLNNIEYNSINNSDMFIAENDKFIFKSNSVLTDGSHNIKAFLRNAYGEGPHTQVYKFIKKTAIERVNEGDIIKAISISDIQNIVINMVKAFNKEPNIVNVKKDDYYKASFYNDCFNAIKEINDYMNGLISNNTFDYELLSREVVPGEINDDLVWEQLITDIVLM